MSVVRFFNSLRMLSIEMFSRRRIYTDRSSQRTPVSIGGVVEPLENRILLTDFISVDTLKDFFATQTTDEEMVIQKDSLTKPHAVAKVDLLSVLGAGVGSIFGGTGAAGGLAVGSFARNVAQLDGYLALDALDLIGRFDAQLPWLTQDAANNKVTISVGYSGGFSFSFGTSSFLQSVTGIGGGISFVEAASPNCDPTLGGGEIWELGGLASGDVFSTDIFSVTLAEGVEELALVEVPRDSLLNALQGNNVIKSILNLFSERQTVDSDCSTSVGDRTGNYSLLPLSEDRFDYIAGDQDSGFIVEPTADGQLRIGVSGVGESFSGAMSLYDSTGQNLGVNQSGGRARNPQITLLDAIRGSRYYVSVNANGQPQTALVRADFVDDGMNLVLPQRVHHDSAGSDFRSAPKSLSTARTKAMTQRCWMPQMMLLFRISNQCNGKD